MKTSQIRETKNGFLKLPEVFTAKGFEYKQIKRFDNKAVYVVKNINGSSFVYEVIKINRHNGYEIAGNKVPPAEVYPSSEQWGIYGWTYLDEQAALKRFNSI